jgi:hypothetical protein
MSTQFVSMSEIMRVAPWSLRALGQPFGVAERGTRLLTWTQATIGHALELLRVGEDRLRQSAQAPAARRSGGAREGRHIDAAGRNLIEVGPPAVDLITADARLSGHGQVVVENVIGTLMVPALADLMSRRGLTAIAAFRAGPDEIRIAGWPSEGWIAAFAGPSGPEFTTGECGDLPALADLFDGEMKLRVLGLARRLAEAAQAGKAVVALAATTAAARAAHRPGAIVDYPGQVARAYCAGLEVAMEDLAHLYALERITWAPTSERSRKQAGY